MTTKSKTTASHGGPATPSQTNLGDVLKALDGHKAFSETRLRDLRSAIRRVASLVGDDPARIALDLPAISAKLATVSPAAAGLTGKSLSNIRSNFMAGLKASGLKSIQRSAKQPLSARWNELISEQSSSTRRRIGLSRLARYASANGIEPEEVDDATVDALMTAVRRGTLHRKPNGLHRKVAIIWNEAAQGSGFDLQVVKVPSFRVPAKRIEWEFLPDAFCKNVDDYLAWSAGTDPFAENARSRALAPQTVKLRRNEIHAAVTALIESGVRPAAITSLADLVSPENFKRILRRRDQMVGGCKNVFNHFLARALVEIARQWVKVDATVLAELKRLAGKVPMPMSGLTEKNKRALRQFDDPAVLRRLYELPNRLWAEVKRDAKPNFLTLAKAQAALAVGMLCFMPIRLQNLATLTFDLHLFMQEGPNATSSLELSAGEVKNGMPLAYDIHPVVAKMLIEYRNRIAPKIIGRRPDRVFVKADGTPKNQSSVAWLIRKYLKRRAGIVLSPHQFRHVATKLVLDAEPGNYETPRQFLGHKSIRTTVDAYAGFDSRRAALHHQHLVEQALAAEKPTRRLK